jgi:PAS domain S-box/diguanylate cyclase (GGDEF) domain
MNMLIIEDNTTTRRLLEEVVRSVGHEATGCVDAQSGWAAYQKQSYPLVILDWMLPGMDGLQLCRKIREGAQGDRSVILMVTVRDDSESLRTALDAGANDYLVKPFDPEVLRVRLRVAQRQVHEIARRKWVENELKTHRDRLQELVDERTKALERASVRLQQEIKERKRAYKTVRQMEERYRAFYEQHPTLYFTLDREAKVLSVNRSGAEDLGLVAEKIVGQCILNLVHPDDRACLKANIDACFLEPSRMRAIELRCASKTAEEQLWVRGAARAIQTANDTVLLLACEDITERKRDEVALFQQQERAYLMLESINEAVIATDGNGLVDYLNPIAEQLTGWCGDEARGQALFRVIALLDEETHQPVQDPVQRCLREGVAVAWTTRYHFINRVGKKYTVQSRASPIRNQQGQVTGAVLVLHDVSDVMRLAYQASHDALTGLVNRRRFEQFLDVEWRRGVREQAVVSVVMIDIDSFKNFNDAAGHLQGDECLKRVASALKLALTRPGDVVARYGGEEFLALLPKTHAEGAAAVAERMRSAVEALQITHPHSLISPIVTISLGVASTVLDRSLRVEELIDSADKALYEAKRQGRNRVVIRKLSNVPRRPRPLEQGEHTKPSELKSN